MGLTQGKTETSWNLGRRPRWTLCVKVKRATIPRKFGPYAESRVGTAHILQSTYFSMKRKHPPLPLPAGTTSWGAKASTIQSAGSETRAYKVLRYTRSFCDGQSLLARWLCKHKIQQFSPARLETKPQTAFLKNLAETLIIGVKCITAQEIQAHWGPVFSVNDCLHKIISVLTVTSLP